MGRNIPKDHKKIAFFVMHRSQMDNPRFIVVCPPKGIELGKSPHIPHHIVGGKLTDLIFMSPVKISNRRLFQKLQRTSRAPGPFFFHSSKEKSRKPQNNPTAG